MDNARSRDGDSGKGVLGLSLDREVLGLGSFAAVFGVLRWGVLGWILAEGSSAWSWSLLPRLPTSLHTPAPASCTCMTSGPA